MYLDQDKWLTKTEVELTLKIRDVNIVKGKIYNFSLLNFSDRDGYITYLYHLKPFSSHTGKLIKIDYNDKKLLFDCFERYNSIFKTIEFNGIAEISEVKLDN